MASNFVPHSVHSTVKLYKFNNYNKKFVCQSNKQGDRI